MGIEGLLRSISPLLIPENELTLHAKNNATTISRSNNSAKTSSSSSRSSKQQTIRHNIRQFANKTIAIDASSWLFKASYSCAERLVESSFEQNNRIDPMCESRLCNYMIKRCDELLTHASIKRIYIVFDGKRSPLKEHTNKERERKRMRNLKEARRLKRIGSHDLAQDKYRACVKVVDWMGWSVDAAVKKKWGGAAGNNKSQFQFAPPKVSCVFSPYEADAQLVKLCVDGISDAIVTEDSDVLVYTAACQQSIPIIYKLSRDDGSCDVLSMDWLFSCHDNQRNQQPTNNIIAKQYQTYPSIRRLLPSNHNDRKKSSALLYHLRAMYTRESRTKGAGARMFVQACVLSGCDYCPNRLSGVGFITACKMIKENAHRNVDERFSRILRNFPKDKILADGDDVNNSSTDEVKIDNCETSSPYMKSEDVPQFIQEYETLLAKSEATFYYHKVQILASGQIVSLIQPSLHCDSESLMNDCRPEVAKKFNRFLPDTVRFNGDLSFTGHEYQTASILSTSSGPAMKRKLPAPSNPYTDTKKSFFVSQLKKRIKSDHTDNKAFSPRRKKDPNVNFEQRSRVKKEESDSSPKGALSPFASGAIASTKLNYRRHDTMHSISSSVKATRRKVYINVDDSDSDSDLLDEKHTLFSRRTKPKLMSHSIVTPNNIKGNAQSSQSTSSLSSDSSTPRCIIKSKYFTFDHSKGDDNELIIQPSPSRITRIPLVTPKVSRKKAETATVSSDPTCNDDFFQDDESSNDCVIVDNPHNSQRSDASSKTSSFLQKNSRTTSLLEKFQSQPNSTSSAQRKSSFTSFSRAQFEGTRAKFSNSKTKKSSQNRKTSPNSTW